MVIFHSQYELFWSFYYNSVYLQHLGNWSFELRSEEKFVELADRFGRGEYLTHATWEKGREGRVWDKIILPVLYLGRIHTRVRSLGGEDPWRMATHSSILAWEILWTEEHGALQSLGSQRVRHNLDNSSSTSAY